MEEMQEYAKHIAQWMLSTFLGVSARKKDLYHQTAMPRNRPKVYKKV